tara:strand:+ start:417 stop:2108 length:1692 start_codon:yes stop_codon:yes gene_type:complete
LTTKKSFNGVFWHSLNNNNDLESDAFSIAQKNNISISLAKLLMNRNIKKIPNFLNSKLKENISITEIMKLHNIEKSIDFFEKVKLEKKIAIFSDYDVDGACSAAICKKLFLQFEIEVLVYIPNRFNEGYGLNTEAIDKMLDFSSNILVLDCGSNNFEEQRYIHEKKGQIMVVDHHECDNFFEQAIVINPKTPNDKSSLNDLCATGLIFLIFVYLKHKNLFSKSDILQYLDLVALATVCDLVPLNAINRSLVKQGLKIINSENLNKGIQTLINQAKIKQIISEYHLGYILGPRINAGGRMGESLLGFQLLSSENIHQALQYAQIIESHNQNRQKIQSQIVSDINLEDSNDQNINFFYSEKWHIGIVGIIAGRLLRINNKPSFIMTTSNDVVVGSGRSLGEKNIGQLMMTAVDKGILIKGGGHAKACGFTLLKEKVNELKLFLNEKTKDIEINNNKYFESLIDLNVVNEKLIKDLDLLSPFGQQNSEPIFKCSDLKISILKVFKEKHAKLAFSDNLGSSCEGMLFDTNISELNNYLSNKSHFDCYFKVKKDSYSNNTVIHLEDIH